MAVNEMLESEYFKLLEAEIEAAYERYHRAFYDFVYSPMFDLRAQAKHRPSAGRRKGRRRLGGRFKWKRKTP